MLRQQALAFMELTGTTGLTDGALIRGRLLAYVTFCWDEFVRPTRLRTLNYRFGIVAHRADVRVRDLMRGLIADGSLECDEVGNSFVYYPTGALKPYGELGPEIGTKAIEDILARAK